DLRRDLGTTDVGALLGLGSEGDVVVHHVGDLRRLPARTRNVRVEGRTRGGRRAGRVRLAPDHVLRAEPVDRSTPLVLRREVSRRVTPQPRPGVRTSVVDPCRIAPRGAVPE